MNLSPPPPVLDDLRVLLYAGVDEAVRFTGRLHLYRDGESVGPVPRLAICQKFETDQLLLLCCNENWVSLGTAAWNGPGVEQMTSLAEIKREVEKYYEGISEKWIALDVPLEAAQQYRDQWMQDLTCSFCGKDPRERIELIEGGSAKICGDCVREFYQWVNDAEASSSDDKKPGVP